MEVVDVKYLGSDGQYQNYSPVDLALINKAFITPSFGDLDDYVEYFIKDLDGNILDANYFGTQYERGTDVNPLSGTTTTVKLDPETDVRNAGYNRGTVNIKYNFFKTYLQSTPFTENNFWIKEISTSRTEIKVARQDLSNSQLANAFNIFNTALSAQTYYPDFLLNFGNDIQVIAVNAVYVEEGLSGYIIFKLYEPLPDQFDLKSTFWVVTQVAESAEFNVTTTVEPEPVEELTRLRGPNYKVAINDSVSQTTPYYTYTNLFATSVSSSFQQLRSMMDEKGVSINVDYSNFENFVHFSSATERLYNFVYKLQLIESASAGLATTNTSTAKVLLQNQINSTIEKFDGYEYYLYFQSASTAWPKSTTDLPYLLYSVTSSQAVNWLGSSETLPTATSLSNYYSASFYDNNNPDLLEYTTPAYIRDDVSNEPYLVFLNMIGQHFDNIWIYLKDVTNRYSAENNPFVGISLDEVGNALKSLGLKLYTNTNISDNIYYSLLGINGDGNLLPPTGSEVITEYVTSSIETLPADQINAEYYKRLYHNLAYLYKTRGTDRGVRALITTFGIPPSILTVHEYGGYNMYDVAGIQEIDNIKITTGSVLEISSSLLSPYSTLQYYDNNKDRTSITVQVGFSPADSINASITSSGYITASNQPGYFNIMQFIGAPDLQYSSSYTPLVQLGNTYFNAEYTSRYDVWDFIRIIKYYNNTLFKLLRDFVPARASADTGIVIKSHILERNKYPRKEPTFTTSSNDADYELLEVSGSDGGCVIGSTEFVQAFPVQYSAYSTPLLQSNGTVYVSSSDDVQKYNGEFSGSTIYAEVNYFPQTEYSSYIYPWTSSVPAPNKIMFTTYSLDATFQNITGSVISQRFLDLDYNSSQLVPVNYGLVTQSLSRSLVIGFVSQSSQPYSQFAQYQDYNQSFRPITIPRYSGSYLSGRYYNSHSLGDVSYGEDPVIDYTSKRVGFFNQIESSSFLPGKVNASLAYLADVSGGLYELNQNNKNWEDVQRTFKAGTTLTIKQFDNRKFSNQVTTDGVKTIYNSGYSYTPQIYFISGSDNRLYFQFVGAGASTDSVIGYNTGTPNAFISGAASPTYGFTVVDTIQRTGNIYNIFDGEANPSVFFSPGDAVSFPSFTASEAGQRTFSANFTVNFQFQDPEFYPAASGSFEFGAYYNGVSLIGAVQSVNFTSSFVPSGTTTGTVNKRSTAANPDSTPTRSSPILSFTGPFDLYVDGVFSTTIGSSLSTLDVAVYLWTENGGLLNYADYLVENASGDIAANFSFYNAGAPTVLLGQPTSGGTPTGGTKEYVASRVINYTTPAYSLSPEDKVVFKFRQTGMSTANYTASLSSGTANSSLTINTISAAQGGYPYATASLATGNFIYDVVDINNLESKIVLSENLSNFQDYLFIPAFASASVAYTSSLYTQYGDVNVSFSPQQGDKIIMADFSGLVQDLDVQSVETVAERISITVVPQVISNWITDPSRIKRFLLLRKFKDEQSVIMTFNKTPGQTSYGLLLPETVSSEVTENINTLQAAVQSQLLTGQSVPPINTIDGGTFG
jgi:hypothetical protein